MHHLTIVPRLSPALERLNAEPSPLAIERTYLFVQPAKALPIHRADSDFECLCRGARGNMRKNRFLPDARAMARRASPSGNGVDAVIFREMINRKLFEIDFVGHCFCRKK